MRAENRRWIFPASWASYRKQVSYAPSHPHPLTPTHDHTHRPFSSLMGFVQKTGELNNLSPTPTHTSYTYSSTSTTRTYPHPHPPAMDFSSLMDFVQKTGELRTLSPSPTNTHPRPSTPTHTHHTHQPWTSPASWASYRKQVSTNTLSPTQCTPSLTNITPSL